jgi:hypothetical protein
MNQRIGYAIGVIALILAACGGGGGSTAPSTAASTAASSEPSVAASSEPSAVASQGSEESPAASTGGGGGAENAFAIITAEEFGGVLDADDVTTQLFDGPVSSCIYSDGNSDAIGATSLTKEGAAGVFQAWASGSGVVPVDGVGDDAVWDPSTATLFVLKGSNLAGIAAGTGADDEADRKAWAIELGGIAAGRM